MNNFQRKFLVVLCVVSSSLACGGSPFSASAQEARTLVVTAYYSPLPDQVSYVTGSYAGDIRLNGNGTNGADGTQVYPGMLAAPKSYAFGTQVAIPGLGIGTVHDRGGAINAYEGYDRIDVWMGAGDVGRIRALQWGKRTVGGTVYVEGGLSDSIYFAEVTVPAKSTVATATTKNNLIASTTTTCSATFCEELSQGDSGESVKKLQNILKEWGYFSSEVTGNFGAETYQAVLDFQLAQKIIASEQSNGAGVVGPLTRSKINQAIASDTKLPKKVVVEITGTQVLNGVEQEVLPAEVALVRLSNKYLQPGDSGEDVKTLQQLLASLNYLTTDEANGYFGEKTSSALIAFQVEQGIVASGSDTGAGYFGPLTRSTLTKLFS